MSMTDEQELAAAKSDMQDIPSRDRKATQTENDDEETITEETELDELEEEEETDTEEKSKKPKSDKEEEEDEEPEEKEDADTEKTSKPRKEKFVPVQKHVEEKNKLKDRITDLENQLAEKGKKDDLKTDSTEEIHPEVKKLAEKMGIEDPAILQEIVNLPLKLQADKIKELEAKLEEKNTEKQAEQGFEDEWAAFLPQLKTVYPNATPAEIAEAKAMMENLAHTEDFHTYPLQHIFKLNREDFNDAVDIKDVKSPGSAKTQGITKEKSKNERPRLSKDPSLAEIKALEDFYNQQESGLESLTLSSGEI